jgi:hypothetical protein
MPTSCKAARVKLPSLAGADAAKLAEVMPALESRRYVVEAVLDALAEMEASLDPVIVLLIGEWGEGKTSVFASIVAPEARRRGWVVLEARASTVLGYLELLRSRGEVGSSFRLLASVLAAAAEHTSVLPRLGGGDTPSSYARKVLSELRRLGRKVVVFIDEFEDVVVARDDVVADAIAGLVGLVNGDIVELSSRCSGGSCYSGFLHLVLSVTPPAYTKLVSLRDFATVAARFKRRVRVVRIPPLDRTESYRFLESLARYSYGESLSVLVDSTSYLNPVLVASQGNMGVLVSLFRSLVSRSLELGRRICGGLVRLSANELLQLLARTTVSVGGADLPALNTDAYSRLIEAWRSYAKSVGLDEEVALRLALEVTARIVFTVDELAKALGLPANLVRVMIAEANAMAESSWVRSELGVELLLHRVKLVGAEEALPRISKALDELGARAELAGGDPLRRMVDALTYVSEGRLVVAVALDRDGWRKLVADALPVDVPSSLVDRIAEAFANAMEGVDGVEAYLLSPKLAQTLYASTELNYLDFVADRVERLKLNRRAYAEASRLPLVIGTIGLLAFEAKVLEQPQPHSDSGARVVVELPGLHVPVRILVYATPGALTLEEVGRLESTLTASILSGWRPHSVLVVSYGGVEEAAEHRIRRIEETLFTKIVIVPIPSLLARLRLVVLGLKLLEERGADEALSLAAKLVKPDEASRLGFDPLRLQAVLRQLSDELELSRRLRRSLEEGVNGAPLIIRDPELGYDVERPTELAGALRYYLVVPSPRAKPIDALRAAHDYVMRYHIYRHTGETRGILSPDIDRREVTMLERYTALLVANGFLERVNGELRIDVLSPQEKAVLKALEQLGARSEWVPAAQIWNLLVVAAKNPGTRRMLLQTLYYRGLVEVQGKRIDPERSRVRLTDTPEAARRLLERARELVARLRESTVLSEWGYVVAAKARDYRVGVVSQLASKLQAVLDTAESALKTGNTLMCLRLARIAADLADYALTELASRAEAAYRKAVELKQNLAGTLEEVRGLRRSLERVLAEYVVEGRVKVKVAEEELLEDLLSSLDTLINAKPGEDDVERDVARVWEEALSHSTREPGRYTPFYINGLGPTLEFNYKLWKIYELLSRYNLVEVREGRLELSSKLKLAAERLASTARRVREVVEQVAELARKVSRMGISLAVGRVKPPGELLSIDDVEKLIDSWRSMVSEEVAEVARLASLLERYTRLRDEGRKLLSEAEDLRKTAYRLVDQLRGSPIEQYATKLSQAVRRLKDDLEELASISALDSPRDVENQLPVLEDVLDRVRSSLALVKKLISEVYDAVRVEVSKLAYEVEALARIAGLELKLPRDIDDVAALNKLQELAEKLSRVVAEKGLLEPSELKAYRVVVRAKRVKGELLFSEAVRLVSRELKVGEDTAKSILLALIAKGVVEPKL